MHRQSCELRGTRRSIHRHPIRAMAAVLVVLQGAASVAILSLVHFRYRQRISYLSPCDRRIRGPQGDVIGVVGFDVPLDTVIKVLRIPDLPHQRRTLLLDENAMFVARESDIGRSHRVGTQGDKKKSLRALGIPGLERKIREALQNDIYKDEDARCVFSRLASMRWYVVVALDGARTLKIRPQCQ